MTTTTSPPTFTEIGVTHSGPTGSCWVCYSAANGMLQNCVNAATNGSTYSNGYINETWLNPGYASFDEFLVGLNRDKRKKIRQERRKVFETGLSFEIRQGSDIRLEDWDFFHRCYVHTYRAHQSTPYLNLDFFLRLGEHLPQHCLLVLGYLEGKPIAAALNLRDGERLYGRYWGSQTFVPGLHFETCYYQGMEYCISQGLKVFEGGAQGEHKLARGFLPVITDSRHWLADQRIRSALGAFLSREGHAVEDYVSELEGPYQQGRKP